MPPPAHPDTAALRELFEHLPLAFRREPWGEADRRRLAEAVLQMVQARAAGPLCLARWLAHSCLGHLLLTPVQAVHTALGLAHL